MRRKIYNALLKWKNEENGAVALLVEGARRVGKSYIVEEFAKREYKSYILVDFAHISMRLRLSSCICKMWQVCIYIRESH